METAAALLFAALILLGAVCACFLVVAQPIWGIVDVATSDKHSGGTKTAIILLTLLLLGPIMTFFYACCGTCSKALRRATLIASGALAFAGVSALVVALATPAAKNLWARTTQARTVAGSTAAPAAEPPAPPPLPADQVAPFTALHLLPKDPSGWSVCIAQFTGYGPKPDGTIPLVLPSIYPIIQLAVAEGPAYYAITTHQVGRIIPATGQFVGVKTDPAIGKPSWPSAIAYDSKHRLLLITARSQGYSYNPSTGEWKTLPQLRDDDIVALAYAQDEEVLYALRAQPGGELATKLLKLSPNGAKLAEMELSHPIAIGRYPFALAQLCWSDKQLIALISPPERLGANPRLPAKPAMYSLDPASGLCRLVDPKAPVELEATSDTPR